MTRIEIRTEEYRVEICENCGHDAATHYDKPKVVAEGTPNEYTAVGCMVVNRNGRRIPNNPHRRCECMKVV